MNANPADLAIFVTVGGSCVLALFRGFLREVLALLTWLIAIWAGFAGNRFVGAVLVRWVDSPGIRWAVSFLVLFTAVLALSAALTWLLSALIRKSGLSSSDRALGLVFGMARGLLIVGVVVGLLRLTPLVQERLWQESALIPYVVQVNDWVVARIPDDLGARIALPAAMRGSGGA